MTKRPLPSTLHSEGVDLWRAEALLKTSQLTGPLESSAFDRTIWKRPALVGHLQGVFRNVCAYCECPYAAGYPAVEHYRPKSTLLNDPAGHKGYYWLAYDDRNYRFACTPCNTNKSSRFPVAGTRAAGPADDLTLEAPLLVDPCESVDPDDHFVFSANGEIAGLTAAGRQTITLLKLNRDILVAQRKTHWMYFVNSINSVLAARDPKMVTFPSPPTYLGVFRAAVHDLRKKHQDHVDFFDGLLDLLRLL